MKPGLSAIPRARLRNHRIEPAKRETASAIVAAMGAMQGQEYASALWAIGLRASGSTEAGIEQEIADRKIVRTWPMRGTLHFVAADDVRWMLRLLTPRVIAGTTRRAEALELDSATFARCRKVFSRVLKGGAVLTREALLKCLEVERISTAGGRGYHILFRLAQEEVICFGPRQGKSHTFVLLDDWIPKSRILERNSALAELALRYFTSHGFATLQDFVWWSGLTVSDAKAGLSSAKLDRIEIGGTQYWGPDLKISAVSVPGRAHFLPAFDEWLLGYKDRSAVLDAAHAGKVAPGSNGVFMNILMIQGRVWATWKRVIRKNDVGITVHPFAPLKKTDLAGLQAASQRCADFLGIREASVSVR